MVQPIPAEEKEVVEEENLDPNVHVFKGVRLEIHGWEKDKDVTSSN